MVSWLLYKNWFLIEALFLNDCVVSNRSPFLEWLVGSSGKSLSCMVGWFLKEVHFLNGLIIGFI